MAAGRSGTALGLPYRADYLEVKPLKLRAKHFPLPCSLRELVLRRYGDPKGAASNETPMQLQALLQYLKNIDNFELTPLEAVLAQAEASGDPSLPTTQHTAILQWLGTALHTWRQRFPLEEPLASQLRPLQSLAAALAVTDPYFLIPGAHPIHQLLDTLQASAIGWHSRLGRAGNVMEKQVARTVGDALAWFEDRDTDLTAICAELTRAAQRDRDRAARMAQRVVETEKGRARTADAKRHAARMINAALEKYQAPEAIGAFLKGPWYASAQLVVLKFGADSRQWEKMVTTTETLLDSLQSAEEPAENRRQYIFEVVTQLPKDIRRLMLGLQHDNDAMDDAVGLVESTHLRVLRNQDLELEQIDPIAVLNDIDTVEKTDHLAAMDRIKTGRWFRIDVGDDEPLRVQLVLKVEREQQLLFTSQAGIKALQQSYREFADLLAQKKVIALRGGVSFSSSLASAAGIDSTGQLEVLAGAGAVTEHAGQETADEPALVKTPATELNLPMGAWLGFHDGATPMMAKLAVHDPELDHYIFVNREGIKLRQLSRQALLKLMNDGLVDILQTDSNFRDKVTLAQQRLEE